jgi:L-lysine 2,3-aminomutase
MTLHITTKSTLVHSMDNYRTNLKIANFLHEVKKSTPTVKWQDLLCLLRSLYLDENLTVKQIKTIQKSGLRAPKCSVTKDESIKQDLKILFEKFNINWGDWKFHLLYRLHLNSSSTDYDLDIVENLLCLTENEMEHVKRLTNEGGFADHEVASINNSEKSYYDLSILPLNIMLDKSVLKYFLPALDYFEPDSTKRADPYGIILGKSRAKLGNNTPAAIVSKTSKIVLGTHKFSHTVLFNIDFYCPIGCSNCYKTRMGTREDFSAASPVYDHPELGLLESPNRSSAIKQSKELVDWMNFDERGQQVYDVILSGGEPLSLSNELITSVLSEFKLASNLKIFRICTGTLFLGLPFRFDDELLNILDDFSLETGVRITIQAHLGNHFMLSPESLIAVDKIRAKGISIYSQIPIRAGINFFIDDLPKTLEYLIELGKIQAHIGVEPYMLIVDMHPSTNTDYIPIELLMQVWGSLVESHDYPGLERPRTLSILCEQGNIILSGHTLFAVEKQVDNINKKVIYKIPRVGASPNWQPEIVEYFTYEEPLIACVNDNEKIFLSVHSK